MDPRMSEKARRVPDSGEPSGCHPSGQTYALLDATILVDRTEHCTPPPSALDRTGCVHLTGSSPTSPSSTTWAARSADLEPWTR